MTASLGWESRERMIRESFLNGVKLIIATALLSACSTATASDAPKTNADRLVDASAQAEIAGDVSRSFSLLHDAVRLDPTNAAAHWQLGEIKAGDRWESIEQTQRRATSDSRMAEYLQRRAASDNSAQADLALARWCRKSNLSDEANYHWRRVLAVDPNNEEALRALGLHWQRGQLLTPNQIAQQKDDLEESKQAVGHWQSKIAKWRRALASGDSAAHDTALAEIRSINDANAIRPIENITFGKESREVHHVTACREMAAAFVEALGKMAGQAATESLVRHAVFAADANVRSSATQKLKQRDQHDFVPILLSGLSMPIESTYSIQSDGLDVRYSHSLYREGADRDWASDSSSFLNQSILPGHKYVWHRRYKYLEETADPPYLMSAMQTAQKRQTQFGAKAAHVEANVAAANAASESLNSQIVPVLTATTGKDFPTARQWWDWWRTANEYAVPTSSNSYAYGDPGGYSSLHPIDYQYSITSDSQSYGQAIDTMTSVQSCFVKGTPVWTKTGQRPIETVEIGDLVLSQNVDTGELKYQPVIGRTIRPPSEIVALTFDHEKLRATRGHLFWVAGTGWRMAKELTADDRLHSLDRSMQVVTAKTDGEAEAFNLVVADFDTYFVGERGLLVHDNMPRRPTQALIPGFVAAPKTAASTDGVASAK
jgi:hypothetical protein